MKKVLAGSLLCASFLFAGGDLAAPMPEASQSQSTSAWKFELEPYMLMLNIDGDSTFYSDRLSQDLNVNFNTILDTLQMGAMIHAEAHHESGWGFMIDYAFMDLKKSTDKSILFDSLKVRQGVLEAYGLYRQQLSSGYLDYFAGIRWWDNDFELSTIGTRELSKKADWVDAIVGIRYTHRFNEQWQFRVHGDIGGGGAESTAGASAGVIYTINDLTDVEVKYKATWVDYTEGTEGERGYFVYDTVTHGLIVGLNFKF